MKIIAVDDDRIALDLLKLCLTDGGYKKVRFMASSLEALQEIKSATVAYDCILLDVEMPERDGIQLCADIRKLASYRNTPILMITKNKKRAEVERAFANGATDYITKPFEFFEVLTRIRVAQRLVRERQAAIDSYIAVQTLKNQEKDMVRASVIRKKVGASIARKPVLAVAEQQLQVTGGNLLSFSIFQNYLERATRDVECEIKLLAMKIGNVDQIFAQTTAEEFLGFLKLPPKRCNTNYYPRRRSWLMRVMAHSCVRLVDSMTLMPRLQKRGYSKSWRISNCPKCGGWPPDQKSSSARLFV